MREVELDAEVVAEEDGGPVPEDAVRPLPEPVRDATPALRGDVRTAAIAAAGGALAGVATVAAMRAVSGSGTRKRVARKAKRAERPANVVASRSFLVDVHVLGR